MIRRFYEYINDLIAESKFLVIIGFNILRFDIPLLIQKGVEYGVGSLPASINYGTTYSP